MDASRPRTTGQGAPSVSREGLLTSLFTHAPSGLFVIDEQMRVVLYNPAAADLTGWAGEDPIEISQNVLEGLACPVTNELPFDPVGVPGRETLQNLRQEIWHEVELKDTRGRRRLVEIGYRPIRDADCSLQYILGTLRDITARRRLEEQLQESKRLAALGTLIAGIAHELRNPLGVILSAAEISANETRSGLQRREATQLVLEEARRLDKSIREFLAFARPRPARPEMTDPLAFCRRVIDIHRNQEPSHPVKFQLVIQDELPMLPFDPDLMRQVLDNLISNAIQALEGRDDGVITLRIGYAPESVCIAIEDNGPGIAPEAVSRLWDPFFTTKEEGTGLGLSIVHQNVEQHRGCIEVESAPGEGTIFYIHLPLPEESAT